jgi:hypothetical protein
MDESDYTSTVDCHPSKLVMGVRIPLIAPKENMNRNQLLYNAAAALTECARFIRPVDKDFVQVMLDKAQELADQITIDEQLEQEVNQFEERIREGLTE